MVVRPQLEEHRAAVPGDCARRQVRVPPLPDAGSLRQGRRERRGVQRPRRWRTRAAGAGADRYLWAGCRARWRPGFRRCWRRISGRYSLIAVPSDVPWGKASAGLVKLIYDQEVLGLIATDRNSSHLAEQFAVKSFVPLIAISADHTLTSVNIPWVFRLPAETSIEDALSRFLAAAEKSGPNRGRLLGWMLADEDRSDTRNNSKYCDVSLASSFLMHAGNGLAAGCQLLRR